MNYLVSRLKSAVVVALLLHGVVRQVDHPVCRVFQIVLSAARPQVSVRVPVGLQVSIYCRADREAPDIELSIFVE
mgnify:CR=1 FL=1